MDNSTTAKIGFNIDTSGRFRDIIEWVADSPCGQREDRDSVSFCSDEVAADFITRFANDPRVSQPFIMMKREPRRTTMESKSGDEIIGEVKSRSWQKYSWIGKATTAMTAQWIADSLDYRPKIASHFSGNVNGLYLKYSFHSADDLMMFDITFAQYRKAQDQ